MRGTKLKRSYIVIFAITCTLLYILACGYSYLDYALYKPTDLNEQTQLETRELQSRVYDLADKEKVYKVVINTLQDDGYMIKNLEKETGYINALKESTRNIIWPSTKQKVPFKDVLEATINITDFGGKTKVRVSFYYKCFRLPYKELTGGSDHIVEVTNTEVFDAQLFQGFFSKLDKALFIEGQKL
jgi:hypothetical protein